jgi:AmmeMemoRadiSam system protein B/AmmeMemoRadiSam system protein A
MSRIKTHRVKFILFLFIVWLNDSLMAQYKMMNAADREPVVAGQFYERSKEQLTKQVEAFLRLGQSCQEEVSALIVPHAGYVYSGEVAGRAYANVSADQEIKNVFVIGSSHRVTFNGASIYNIGDYQTPIGVVVVNKTVANALMEQSRLFSFRPEAHSQEHSLEVQLPFLQVHLKKPFELIPIVIGTRDAADCKQLAKALRPYFVPGNLFVISSDFSHYPDYETAKEVDRQTADAILSNEPEKLMKALKNCDQLNRPDLLTGLCGWTSVLTLMYLTEDVSGVKYKHIWYQNSGDVAFGDKNRVVGYHAISVMRERVFGLQEKQKEMLMDVARKELRTIFRSGVTVELDEGLLSKEVGMQSGAFVSLYLANDLRGCIGSFQSEDPLWLTVQEMTRAAATRDSRFRPVEESELDNISIEISVLSPLKKIRDASEIILGKHGVYMKKGGLRGTFLPQVAVKTGWTLEEFLGHCAKDKAHIGWDGWREAELYVYEVTAFKSDSII